LRCLVTGAAGFIGSALCRRLLNESHEVVGIDSFLPYYDRRIKEQNLPRADAANWTFLEKDVVDVFALRDGAAPELVAGVDVVFHQAAQAGVRSSWGKDFSIYTHNNILATQLLLEACKAAGGVKVVYASSSSVYGETERFPMNEDDVPAPVSPYGVSKLAGEHLARLYHHNFGLHTVSLRYFTVYGPGQRPDMAFHRLIRSAYTGDEFRMFGDGEQTRDFTFVGDIVQANLDAARAGQAGAVYNLGGGTRVSMNQVIEMVERVTGKQPNVKREGRQKGDVTNTGADTTRARDDFGFKPSVSLEEGLAREAEYIQQVILAGPEPFPPHRG